MSILTENKVVKFIRESFDEVFHHVTWTKYSELQGSTTLVLVASIIFALVVGFVDFLFKHGLEFFYQSFN